MYSVSSQIKPSIQTIPFTCTSSASTKKSCEYCGKEYTRKTSWQRHVLLCETLHKSKREQLCEQEETDNIPTRAELYHIIQELAVKYENLQEKMNELQKWVQSKKKKVDIIDWLNSHFPHPSYPTLTTWICRLQIDECHVQQLMEESLVQTIQNILRTHLPTNTPLPLAAFTQKTNILYTLYQIEIDNTFTWKTFSQEEFVSLIKQIHSRLLRRLCEWRSAHAQQMADNEKLAELYNKTVIKLMSLNFSQESTALSKIRSFLYQHLKIDLKQTLELEFE